MISKIILILVFAQTIVAVRKMNGTKHKPRNLAKHKTIGLAKHNFMQPMSNMEVPQGQQSDPQVMQALQGNFPNGGQNFPQGPGNSLGSQGQQSAPQVMQGNFPNGGPFLGSSQGQGGPPQGQGNGQNFPQGPGNGQGFPQGNFPQGNNQNSPPGQGNFPSGQGFPQGNFPQGQGNGQGGGQGFPQGGGQGFPQNGGQGFPQGGGGQGFPQGQGNGLNGPQGQNPSDYYGSDYYYYDDTATTVNDAASFSKRQGESTPLMTGVPMPVSPSNPSSPRPHKKKHKNNKQGRNPLRRRRPGRVGNGFSNPLKPQLKVSVRQVQLLPVRRPGWRHRRRKVNPDDKNTNGTITPAKNQTALGQAGIRGKKNGHNKSNQRNRKNKQNGNRIRRKKKGTKKPNVSSSTVANIAITSTITGIPFANSRRPRMTTPQPDYYYYDYYDSPNPNDQKSPNREGSTMSQNWMSLTPANGAMSYSWTMTTSSPLPGYSGPMSTSEAPAGLQSGVKSFCQEQDFNDATYCCVLEAPSLFETDDMDECLADLDPDNEPPSIDEYTVNEGLDEQGNIDFNAPAMKNITDAILKDQPDSLDYEEMINYMERVVKSDDNSSLWLPLFKDAAKDCSSSIQSKMTNVQDRINDVDSTCFTKPYLFIQCIKTAFIMKCPVPSNRATGKLKKYLCFVGKYCMDQMSALKRCNPFD